MQSTARDARSLSSEWEGDQSAIPEDWFEANRSSNRSEVRIRFTITLSRRPISVSTITASRRARKPGRMLIRSDRTRSTDWCRASPMLCQIDGLSGYTGWKF